VGRGLHNRLLSVTTTMRERVDFLTIERGSRPPTHISEATDKRERELPMRDTNIRRRLGLVFLMAVLVVIAVILIMALPTFAQATGETFCTQSDNYDCQSIEQTIFVAGNCILDEDNIAHALYSVEGRPGAVFTVNGVNVGSVVNGGTALFGENVWSANALLGYVIVGSTEGTFVIEDCGPTTTTIGQTTITTDPTTTIDPGSSDTTTTTTLDPGSGDTTSSSIDPTLPFTGPDNPLNMGVSDLIAAGSLLVLLGGMTVMEIRTHWESE